MTTKSIRARGILLLLLKFALFAPICLAFWWMFLPYYAWLLGQLTRPVLHCLLNLPVDAVFVERRGLLNTDSLIHYVTGMHDRSLEVVLAFTNMAPFAALVLATDGLAVRRCIKILATGAGILVLTHLLFLILALFFQESIRIAPDIPTALGQLCMTLPFPLWVVLAYWDKTTALPAPGQSPSQSS